MPARFILLLVLPLFWLVGCSSVPGDGARSGSVTVITGDLPVLVNGMSAAEVRQMLGEPAEIKPMESAAGKAEVWLYHLEKYLGRTELVTFVNRPAPGASFESDPSTMIPEPVTTWVDHKLRVTLRLLMFNGRLTSQTARSEQLFGS